MYQQVIGEVVELVGFDVFQWSYGIIDDVYGYFGWKLCQLLNGLCCIFCIGIG